MMKRPFAMMAGLAAAALALHVAPAGAASKSDSAGRAAQPRPARPAVSFPPELMEITPFEWVMEQLEGRLDIGTRVTVFRIVNSDRTPSEPYLGTITRLVEDQDLMPLDLYAAIRLTREWGVEICRERIAARAVTHTVDDADGTFVLEGPVVSVVWRPPVDSYLQPYFTAGVTWMKATMIHNPTWHLGFHGTPEERWTAYDDWIAQGAPAWPNDGYERTMDPADSFGWTFGAGIAVHMWHSVFAEVMVRYMDIATDTHMYLSSYGTIFDDRGITTFPMRNTTLGVGVRYSF